MTFSPGWRERRRWPMACMRCVLPSPVPPQTRSGLYWREVWSATRSAAACARRFDEPVTKFSNVYAGFRPPARRRGSAGSFCGLTEERNSPSAPNRISRVPTPARRAASAIWWA